MLPMASQCSARHYPAFLCLWAISIAAILANDEPLSGRLPLEPLGSIESAE
jgi:hypothetical protein